MNENVEKVDVFWSLRWSVTRGILCGILVGFVCNRECRRQIVCSKMELDLQLDFLAGEFY